MGSHTRRLMLAASHKTGLTSEKYQQLNKSIKLTVLQSEPGVSSLFLARYPLGVLVAWSMYPFLQN